MAKYLVTSSRTFRGYQPAEVFEADLTEAEETRYKARGSITDLAALNREDLNRVAAEAGVENPTSFSTKGDLVAAIENQDNAGEAGGDEGSK